MSRTRHHGSRRMREQFPAFHYGGTPPADSTPPKRKRASTPWFWMRGAPSDWHNRMHTRPWRRCTNADIYREVQSMWSEDVWMPGHAQPTWRDDLWVPAHAARAPGAYRRPHVYYW